MRMMTVVVRLMPGALEGEGERRVIGYRWRRRSSSSTALLPHRRGLRRGWEWERRPTAAASGELLLLPSSPAATPPSTAGSLPGPLP